MFVISFFYQMFSVRVDARSLFIKEYMLIWILLYNNLTTILLLRYQNNLKKHTYNDYTEESSNDYDMWLENPDWKVLPTISFVDGYPRV